jgi:hypothetical protein
MTDPKNIVIKVKYTAPDAATETPATKMVTEWNIKRIVSAVGIAILLLISLYILWRGKIDQADTTQSETAPNMAPVSKPSGVKAEPQPQLASTSINPDTSPDKAEPQAVSTPVEPASPSDTAKEPMIASHPPLSAPAQGGRIRRAALAYRIIDKEPAELIGTTVSIGNGKPVLVHYFTEVRGKTAQILFHEWIKNGETILQHPMPIAAERWRTSSQHQFGQDDLGNWSVRTVDDKGALMNEIHFTVSAK